MKSIFSNRAARIEAFRLADLYPVISSEFCLGRDPYEIFVAAAKGGAKVIQLREKNRGKKYLYELACQCRQAANDYGVLLIINDHVDVAVASHADGVHLGQDDLPLAAARMLSDELILGNSTHDLAEATLAQQQGFDYINIGPIYPTGTKTVNCGALGIETLRRIAPHVKVPYSVMGGIKRRHLADLVAAGARRIAMVTEITQADDVEATVRELKGSIHHASC